MYVEDYQTLQRSEIRRVAASCPRLWLVSSHVGVPPATATATAHYVRYEALLSSLGRHFSHRSRATFGYAQQVDVWLFST